MEASAVSLSPVAIGRCFGANRLVMLSFGLTWMAFLDSLKLLLACWLVSSLTFLDLITLRSLSRTTFGRMICTPVELLLSCMHSSRLVSLAVQRMNKFVTCTPGFWISLWLALFMEVDFLLSFKTNSSSCWFSMESQPSLRMSDSFKLFRSLGQRQSMRHLLPRIHGPTSRHYVPNLRLTCVWSMLMSSPSMWLPLPHQNLGRELPTTSRKRSWTRKGLLLAHLPWIQPCWYFLRMASKTLKMTWSHKSRLMRWRLEHMALPSATFIRATRSCRQWSLSVRRRLDFCWLNHLLLSSWISSRLAAWRSLLHTRELVSLSWSLGHSNLWETRRSPFTFLATHISLSWSLPKSSKFKSFETNLRVLGLLWQPPQSRCFVRQYRCWPYAMVRAVVLNVPKAMLLSMSIWTPFWWKSGRGHSPRLMVVELLHRTPHCFGSSFAFLNRLWRTFCKSKRLASTSNHVMTRPNPTTSITGSFGCRPKIVIKPCTWQRLVCILLDLWGCAWSLGSALLRRMRKQLSRSSNQIRHLLLRKSKEFSNSFHCPMDFKGQEWANCLRIWNGPSNPSSRGRATHLVCRGLWDLTALLHAQSLLALARRFSSLRSPKKLGQIRLHASLPHRRHRSIWRQTRLQLRRPLHRQILGWMDQIRGTPGRVTHLLSQPLGRLISRSFKVSYVTNFRPTSRRKSLTWRDMWPPNLMLILTIVCSKWRPPLGRFRHKANNFKLGSTPWVSKWKPMSQLCRPCNPHWICISKSCMASNKTWETFLHRWVKRSKGHCKPKGLRLMPTWKSASIAWRPCWLANSNVASDYLGGETWALLLVSWLRSSGPLLGFSFGLSFSLALCLPVLLGPIPWATVIYRRGLWDQRTCSLLLSQESTLKRPLELVKQLTQVPRMGSLWVAQTQEDYVPKKIWLLNKDKGFGPTARHSFLPSHSALLQKRFVLQLGQLAGFFGHILVPQLHSVQDLLGLAAGRE